MDLEKQQCSIVLATFGNAEVYTNISCMCVQSGSPVLFYLYSWRTVRGNNQVLIADDDTL